MKFRAILLGVAIATAWSESGFSQCGEQILTPGDPATQVSFGREFSLDDGYLASSVQYSGASGGEGAVVVFEQGPGGWTEQQTIFSPNPGMNHGFGSSLILSGDTLLVREVRQDLSLFPEGGPAVHVYTRQAGQWAWQQKLEAPVVGAPTLTHFGQYLALDGDRAYVSDNWRDIIHVYDRNGNQWTETTPISKADTSPLAIPIDFPRNFVVKGDRLLVAIDAGPRFNVYVLDRDSTGWHGTDVLDPSPSSLLLEPDFDFEGGTAFIGSEADAGQAGRVFRYEESGGQWNVGQIMIPDPWFGSTRFGHRLDLRDGLLAVSAPAWDLPIQNAGRVYLFEPDGLLWSQSGAIDGSQPEVNLMLGYDVAISGGAVVAGAPGPPGGAGRIYDFQLAQPLGVPYGETNANSTGSQAKLAASGSASVDSGCLTLVGSNLPPNRFGHFLMAREQGLVTLPGASQGNLHLALPIVRFAGDILTADAMGNVVFSPDLTALPQGATFHPGDTWNFQIWFRDTNPGPTSNTTNGLALTFATSADPSVQFPVTLGVTPEDASRVGVTITLSQETSHDVLIPYTTSGTSIYGVDWRLNTPSPIVIPAGSPAIEVSFIIAEDQETENDETAILTLGPPTGGVIGTATQFTLTIEDDD